MEIDMTRSQTLIDIYKRDGEVLGMAGELLKHSVILGSRLQLALVVEREHEQLIMDSAIESLSKILSEKLLEHVAVSVSTMDEATGQTDQSRFSKW